MHSEIQGGRLSLSCDGILSCGDPIALVEFRANDFVLGHVEPDAREFDLSGAASGGYGDAREIFVMSTSGDTLALKVVTRDSETGTKFEIERSS